MNIGTTHGTFASRSILSDIFSDLGVFQQPVRRRGNAYAIFRNEYEEIGGVVVRGTSLGDTQLQPYVEEPQEKNKQIVALVAQQMSDALLMIVGRMG